MATTSPPCMLGQGGEITDSPKSAFRVFIKSLNGFANKMEGTESSVLSHFRPKASQRFMPLTDSRCCADKQAWKGQLQPPNRQKRGATEVSKENSNKFTPAMHEFLNSQNLMSK